MFLRLLAQCCRGLGAFLVSLGIGGSGGIMISLITDYGHRNLIDQIHVNHDMFLNQHLPVILVVHALLVSGGVLWASGRLMVYVCSKRAVPPGRCASCGYCLTGLPEPRCPECGTSFPT